MGELYALLAALSWTTAAYGFRHLGGTLTPLQLNLWKGILACLGLAAFIAISGQWISLPSAVWLPLLLSGLIGITLICGLAATVTERPDRHHPGRYAAVLGAESHW